MIHLLWHLVSEHVIDKVNHAPGAGGNNNIGACCLDAIHLFVSYLLCKIIVIDAEGTTHAAAQISIGHFNILQSLQGLQDSPWLILDVLIPDKMAGIMPGGSLAFKLFFQFEFFRWNLQDINDKFCAIFYLLLKCLVTFLLIFVVREVLLVILER